MLAACPRIAVAKLGNLLPTKFVEAMEQNQLLASCCRHPENHEIEAYRSSEREPGPDIYVFICSCGRRHWRYMAGGNDVRPMWDVR